MSPEQEQGGFAHVRQTEERLDSKVRPRRVTCRIEGSYLLVDEGMHAGKEDTIVADDQHRTKKLPATRRCKIDLVSSDVLHDHRAAEWEVSVMPNHA